MHVKRPCRCLCEDDKEGIPKFMYCVNVTITDKVKEAGVVFSNEAMTGMIKITCEEMVTTYGYSDPQTRPDKLLEIIDCPKIMMLTITPNLTIAVKVVSDTEPKQLPPANATTIPALPPVTLVKQAYNTNRGFLVVVWNGTLYANGCYTSIISFGDSIADTGNIKHMAAITNQTFPSLFPPYGQTFFHKPTGRCSDGRLIIDFLAESLGLPLVPPYMHEGSGNVLKSGHGVNYAVAGATALGSLFLGEEGIQNPVANASLGIELGWFKHSLRSICNNPLECRNLIGSSLILLGEVGGNDYNFPILDGRPIDEVKSLVPIVVNTIVSIINELIELGAQTLVVPGNFPIGCSSAYLTVCGSEKEEYDPTTGCLVRLNQFAEYHNELLQMKLNQIRELHPYVSIIYADYYNAAMQIYRFPYKFGFTNGALKACCGGGGEFNYNLTTTCGDESASVCDEPSTYANWDGIHLTEAAYKVIFKGLFQGPYTTPAFSSLCPTLHEGVIGLSSS